MGKSWIIGAADSCDIRTPSAFVSARHCKLDFDGSSWVITDLDSTNGTFVNGVKVQSPTLISGDDVVTLGRSFPLPWPDSEPRPARSCADQPADARAGTAEGLGGLRLETRHVSVDIGGRRLLDDVSLVFSPGELVGVMGTSGAGKSTFLETLVGASAPSRGVVLVGDHDLYAHHPETRGLVGYVPQDDIMHADLTPQSALHFAARLRLPSTMPACDIDARIDAILKDLDIAAIAKTRIGSPDRRGISGGQRKRVNVAIELLTDPPILVLDEPTSGLSSTDALSLMRLLRRIASAGKTVILTIHQPNADILRLFDAVAVIAKDHSTGDRGTLVWFGPGLPDALAFFEPDRIVREATVDPDGILRGLQSRPVALWRSAYLATGTYRRWVVDRPYRDAAATTASSQPQRPRANAVRQCLILCRRMLAVKLGDMGNTSLLLLQAPVIATLVAAVFAAKTRTLLEEATWVKVSSGLGMTTFLLALAAIWFGCSNAAREIVSERAIYRREFLAGLSPAAYMGSKVLVLSAFCLLQCTILLAIVGPICGLQGRLPVAFLFLVLGAQAGSSLGLALSTLARTPEGAAAALPLLILPMVILGGILLPLGELPAPMSRAADFMPSRWAFEGLIVNEAASRMTLSTPDPARPDACVLRDIASQWFPAPQGRSAFPVCVAILALLWMAGLFAACSFLQPRLVDQRPRAR